MTEQKKLHPAVKSFIHEWKVSGQSASKSNNKAIAKATEKKYFMSVCVQTVNKSVTLTCSNTGKLS